MTDTVLEPGDLKKASSQLQEAAAAKKCWSCGCLHDSLKEIEAAFPPASRPPGLELATAAAREQLRDVRYDCLGCEVCFPAIAVNALAIEGFGCANEPVDERSGWPPLPGDFLALRYRSPVAVCTLNSDELWSRLAEDASDGLAIVGSLHTENLGIERIIRNVLANPHIRFFILCGKDTQQAIGHLPGQSLASLFEGGIDDRGRIAGAKGRRPVLRNVNRDEVETFRRQVEAVNLIGEEDTGVILEQVADCRARSPGPFEGTSIGVRVETIQAAEPERLVIDTAGFFVVYPEPARGRLVLEHYTVKGVLDCVIEGQTPAALYSEAIERQLVSRLDHAAYLGRELARAVGSMETGDRYVQDRAPGSVQVAEPAASCSCSGACETGGASRNTSGLA